MDKQKLETGSLLILLGGISLLTFYVFFPFIHVLILACILSVLLTPLYKKLLVKLKINPSILAGLLVVTVLIFIITPLLGLAVLIFRDSQGLFLNLATGQSQYTTTLQHIIEVPVRHFIPTFSIDISYYISEVLSFVSTNLGGLISGTAYIIFQIFFLLFAFFFILRDGKDILASVIALSPFEPERTKEIIESTEVTINSVIKGTLFVGLIRWVILAGCFYLVGIPNAILWGTLGALVSAIPGLGTPFAIVPAVLFLLFGHHITHAILLGVSGIVIILFVDNYLTTYFFGRGLDVSPIFILFSLLGGLIFFGPLGFIYGPIVLSLFISVINVYKIVVLKKR